MSNAEYGARPMHQFLFPLMDRLAGLARVTGRLLGPQVFLVEQVADRRMTKVALRVVSAAVAGVKVRMGGGPRSLVSPEGADRPNREARSRLGALVGNANVQHRALSSWLHTHVRD